MFTPTGQVRIWLCKTPTDMRKSFAGLSALAKHGFKENPLSGDLFVFVNRRRNLLKILYFDQTGYAIWSKQLAQGQFVFDARGGIKARLSAVELQCLLEGVELRGTRRYKRFTLPAQGYT